MDKIVVCMGSSCFSRGNADNVAVVQQFIKEKGLEKSVEMQGCLCKGLCKSGPNVEINGKMYGNVSGESLLKVLENVLGGSHE